MSDEQKPTIHAERKTDDTFVIGISHCNLQFKGSSLEIVNEGIEFTGISRENLSQLIQNNSLNLAYDGLPFTLEINACQIENTYPNLDLDFRGKSLRLENCSVSASNVFSFVWTKGRIKHNISGLGNGWFSLDSDGHITTQNVLVDFPDNNISVDTTGKRETEWTVQVVEAVFCIISGEIKSLELNRSPCTVEIRKNSSVSKLNLRNLCVFHEIQSDSDACKIKRNDPGASGLEICSLNHVKAFEIHRRITSFLCDTCDFSETRIQFSENASLSFKQLESTATLWNPSLITYRGFCPSRLKETKKINGIPAARQFFCEMKTFFSNKGDSITAGDFHAAEMIAYRRYLQLQGLTLWHDRFILWVSHWSSRFGQNWHWATGWYFLSGLMFALLFFRLGNLCPSCYQGEHFWSNLDCSSFGLFFLHVLSPLNLKLDDIGLGLISSVCLTLLWMLWKIIGSFLIFQIISSSRRFIRKW